MAHSNHNNLKKFNKDLFAKMYRHGIGKSQGRWAVPEI